MLFRRSKRLCIDLGCLKVDEKNLMVTFLRSSLKSDVKLNGNKVFLDAEKVSIDELKRLVNKGLYHKNLNRKYWVAVEGNEVKVNRFEKAKKQEKQKKETTPPQTITHGW